MNRMIENFKNGEFVVNCRTEDQAKKFVKICYDNGIEWFDPDDHKSETYWDCYGYEICYRADDYDLCCASIEWYNGEWQIITFDEFMEEYEMKNFTKDNLKVGMLVEFKCDVRKVVMPNKNGLYLMGCSSSYELHDFNDDLTHKNNDDIMKVYDLPRYNIISNSIYSRDNRNLLWEREEVKELTIDEISELLGYKVKVVGGNE